MALAGRLSTSRLPGHTRTQQNGLDSGAPDAVPSLDGADAANQAALHSHPSSHFLNRVRKFDSCRGHASLGVAPTAGPAECSTS
jgi:hypothetical protein